MFGRNAISKHLKSTADYNSSTNNILKPNIFKVLLQTVRRDVRKTSLHTKNPAIVLKRQIMLKTLANVCSSDQLLLNIKVDLRTLQ